MYLALCLSFSLAESLADSLLSAHFISWEAAPINMQQKLDYSLGIVLARHIICD
jgi:hypothetical protein